MSRLIDLIDEYRDAHGQPSNASIARAIGVSPQLITAWRSRGIKELPSREALKNLAALIGKDYERVVLHAVLLDVGWIEEPTHPKRQSS